MNIETEIDGRVHMLEDTDGPEVGWKDRVHCNRDTVTLRDMSTTQTLGSIASDVFPFESQEIPILPERVRGNLNGTPVIQRYVDEKPDSSVNSDLSILCVHGNPTWSFYYRRVIERFSTTHRVLAVDHLGCGRSDKPPASQFDYCFTNHRDNLINLIDHLDLQRVVLVAHDWGGAIGLSAMLHRRERLAGVALLNTAAFPPPYIPWRISACRFPALGPWAVRQLNAFAGAAITMAVSRKPLDEEARSGLLAPYDTPKNRVAIEHFVRDIPTRPEEPTYQGLRWLEEQLPAIPEIPKALVWGMKDWCFRPECLERLIGHWPEADVNRISDAGHYVLEDAPEEVLGSIDELVGKVDVA
ncbi:MAG: alpha/beta fold hydrolase [Planctomycetota bacterium]